MRIIMLAFLVLPAFIAVPPSAGQEETPPEAAEPAQDPSGRTIDPLLLEPADLINLCRRDLVFWPEDRGVRAADMVYAGGPDTIPVLMKLLEERDYRIKPAAADLLSRLGHKEAWEPIKNLLFHPGLKLKVKYIFAALHRLDPAKTLTFCAELLKSEQRALRNAAFNFIITKKDLEILKDRCLELLESDEADVRRHAFLLLGKTKTPLAELNGFALGLVGDEDPKLADEVKRHLSLQKGAEIGEGLLALLESDDDRIFAFAVLALVSRELTVGPADLPLETASRLEPMLQSRDPLMKVTAAAGFTSLSGRQDTDEERLRLQRLAVPAFMEVFLGGQYCRDFTGILDTAALCLRDITGAPFDKNLTFWKVWWREHAREFQEEEILLAVNEGDLDRLIVRFDRRSGPRRMRFQLAGEGLMGDADLINSPLTCFASARDLGALVDAFYAADFFNQAASFASTALTRPDGSGDGDAGGTSIALTLGDRTASLRTAESENSEAGAAEGTTARLEAALMRAFHRNAWQLLHSGSGFTAWYVENSAWWNDPANTGERTARFIEDLFRSFNLLSEETVLACLEWLRGRQDLGDHFGLKEWGELAERLRSRGRIDTLSEVTVDLIVQASSSATGSGPDLFEPLTSFLFAVYGEDAYPLIEKAIVGMGREREAEKDLRWFVRAAAARLLRDDERAVPVLVSFFDDNNAGVRVEALRSLAVIGTSECSTILAHVMEEAEDEPRRELMAALEGITTSWALDIFETAATGDSDYVRTASLPGLARFRGERAGILIQTVLQSFPDLSQKRREAAARLAAAGGPTARDALYAFYERIENDAEKLLLAQSLAELGDTRVVPDLLDDLEGPRTSEAVRRSLTLLLVSDIPQETWRYRKLWEENPGRSQAFFLKTALEKDGLDLAERPEGVEAPAGSPDELFEGIPVRVLVESLAGYKWYVSQAALRILEEGSGLRLGRGHAAAGRLDMNQVRHAWERWLETR